MDENIILHWVRITLGINPERIFRAKENNLADNYVILPPTLGENQLAGFLRFLEEIQVK